MKTNSYDVVVIGASLGGVMSAVSACKYGLSVLLTEETDWIGGQLTSQAVPPDEHKYIEHTGCTASYREYRNKVRDYYRTHPYIIDELKNKEFFCPGGSSVSRLAHPPRLALKFLEEMVQPYIDNGCLTIMKNTVLTAVDSDSNEIRSVTVSSNNQFTTALAKVYIDGTDTGELVALSKTEYITGDEGIKAYSEPSASLRGDKRDMQPINWAVAVERNDKNVCDNIIPKPAEYDYFHSIKMPYDKYSVLSMYGPDSATSRAKQFGFYNEEIGTEGQKLFGLFGYRRIISSRYFKDNYEPYDVTLLNLPQNDFFMGNIFDDIQAEHNKYLSKQLTLSLLYYLQTEAPREGGKRGYGELALRKDILGTVDGLAKSPYVRESRRIKAKFTVTENDISRRYAPCAPHFWD
ncbi:MAG: FAD-dependent oxidoreductase, partial [Clostridia bacterium]